MRKLMLVSAALAAMTMAARADTFTYDGYTVDPNNVNVNVLTPKAETVQAGQIILQGAGPNAGQTLAVWCLDLIDTLLQGPYTFNIATTSTNVGAAIPGPQAQSASASQLQQIANLMEFGNSGSDTDKAATQIAIWEVLYGSSFTTSTLSGGLLADIASQLASVQPGGTNYRPGDTIEFLYDAPKVPNQTVGTPFAVPGPLAGAGLPGLIIGLLGFWGLNRHKKQIGKLA